MKPFRSGTLLALLSFSASICYSSPVYGSAGTFDNIEPGDQIPLQLAEGPLPQSWPGVNPEDPASSLSMPSWSTSHLLARRLLALSTTGVLTTIFPDGSPSSSSSSSSSSGLGGVPIGLPDYLADCANDEKSPLFHLLGPGNPLILALNIGTTFRNVKAGSNISLSLDWWHSADPGADADKSHEALLKDGEGESFRSLASLPRLSLIGTLEPIPVTPSDDTQETLEKCFLEAHPDARYWLPGDPNAVHGGYWARLVVHQALWIGGFGDRARIGWLDMDTWKQARKEGNNGEQGWDDVKLPGE